MDVRGPLHFAYRKDITYAGPVVYVSGLSGENDIAKYPSQALLSDSQTRPDQTRPDPAQPPSRLVSSLPFGEDGGDTHILYSTEVDAPKVAHSPCQRVDMEHGRGDDNGPVWIDCGQVLARISQPSLSSLSLTGIRTP